MQLIEEATRSTGGSTGDVRVDEGNRVRVRLGRSVRADQTTGEALKLMKAEATDFVPVTEVASGKLVGVVLRKAVERGCWGMGHDPERCPIDKHLKTEVRFCFESDGPDAVLEAAVAEGPVVVVDSALMPIGILELRV